MESPTDVLSQDAAYEKLKLWPEDAHPPGFHSYFKGLPESGRIDPTLREAWRKKMGITPRQFVKSLFNTERVRPGDGRLSLETDDDGLSLLSLSIDLLSPDKPKIIGRLERDFEFYEDMPPEAYHRSFHLQESAQGGGIARDLLANSVKLYERAGITKVRLYAAMQVGGYAWARYGFRPDSREEARELLDQVEDRLWSLKDVPDRARELVERLTYSGEPKAIWAISDLSGIKVTRRGQEMTLGKALLMGTSWKGVLDLEDPEARQRFQQYVHPSEEKAR